MLSLRQHLAGARLPVVRRRRLQGRDAAVGARRWYGALARRWRGVAADLVGAVAGLLVGLQLG